MQKRNKAKKKHDQLLEDRHIAMPYDCDDYCDLSTGELCRACQEWELMQRQPYLENLPSRDK